MADNMNNDTEFDSMLNAANKKLGNDSGTTSSSTPAGSTGKLTQEEIERLLNMSDDTPDEADIPDEEPVPEGVSFEIPADAIAEEDEDEDEEIASFLEASIIGDKEKDEDEEEESLAPAPVIIEKKKSPLPIIFTFLAVIVAGALGFCVAILLFTDVIKSGSEEFAIKAANAVNSQLEVNTELFIYKAYVKTGATSTECMLYGMESFDGENIIDIYRVVIKNDEPGKISVYHTLDENNPDYIAMKNSEDPEIRIQASMLKNYSDTIALADKEISIGSPSWEEIDCNLINGNINSEQIKTAS